MRVGFVTQLLWDRYGSFWHGLLSEAGAEVSFPDLQQASSFLEDKRVLAVPGLAFRLAVAQALSLDEVDLIVAPSLNWGSESQRGGGQDPWIADFPAALGTIGGLPPIMAVPAWLTSEFESLAVGGLQQIARDPGRVRRIWDRHRAGLRYEALSEPRWGSLPPSKKRIGVIGQPWLLREAVTSILTGEAISLTQRQIDPLKLREEGERLEPRTIPTDQEVLGAARLFSRRGGISEIHMIVDHGSGPDIWLRERVQKHAGKPLVTHDLHELLEGSGPFWFLPEGERE